MKTHLERYANAPLTRAAILIIASISLTARAESEYYMELAKKAEIRRDEYGVPHILAPTEESAALAFGYAQGEDYPDLLPRLFVAGRGESAKYFGEKEEQKDVRIKTLGLYEDSVSRFGTLKPHIQAVFNAFAAGYNMALEKGTGEKQPWELPITGPDVLAHGRNVVVLEFTFNLNRFSSLPEKPRTDSPKADLGLNGSLFADDASAHSADPFGVEPAFNPGSNMWGLGKGHTASGRGILLANPHLSWAGAQTFYEAHINIPGVMNISGSTLIGSPGITIGFNEYLGWSHTVNRFDSHDIYELENDPKNADHYIYDGISVPLTRREITIEVKTAQGVSKKTQTVYDSHFGPILFERGGKRYAIKSPNLRELNMIEQWNLMGKARNLKEFKAALDLVAIPMFNIAYADRDGNCFYIYNGRIPERPDGYPWEGIVPGNTSKADWSVVHPVAELPQLTNPTAGYVQNCNDAPWYTNARQLIDKNLYPSYMCDDGCGLRTQNSVSMLEADDSMTLDEVKSYKFNTRMLSAERFKADLIGILERSGGDSPEMQQALKLLRDWDGRANADSKGALLFGTWFSIFQTKLRASVKKPWTPDDPFKTPTGIGDEAWALEAMKNTLAKMKEEFGGIDLAWGDIHHIRRGTKTFRVGGGPGEIGFFRVLSYRPAPKDAASVPGERLAVGGDSYVLAVEFTDPPTAYSVTAYGETERADSPHYTDQTELFAKQEFKRAYFTEEDVKAHTARSYHPGD